MILAIAICLLSGPLREETKWTAPNQLPFPRVHGVVVAGKNYFVGGLEGLVQGTPGKWKVIDKRPVKQLAHFKESVWVMFGDGSIDKIEYKRERLVYEVLLGRVKRPWASCLASDGKFLYIGTQGGWIEDGEEIKEIYRQDMESQVVTAITPVDGDLWLGTQRKGIFRYSNGNMKRFGFAAGLPDSWITAMVSQGKSLVVGVAEGGLFRFENGKFTPLNSPCEKVRQLITVGDRLVVGGMDGCWIQNGTDWQMLTNEETTSLAIIKGQLTIGTPTGISWWKIPRTASPRRSHAKKILN